MQVRIPKVRRSGSDRPVYGNAPDGDYVEQLHSANNRDQFMRSILRIVGLCVVLLVLIIFAIITAVTPSSTFTNQITAADTYAVSAQAQREMKQTMEDFITGMILFSYCSDEQVANEGKQLALSTMAQGSDSYALVDAMTWDGGSIPADSLSVVIGGISMDSGTRAYAGAYTYVGRGGAADTSVVDDANPDGTLVDRGLSFTVSFSQVADVDGNNPEWKITTSQIRPT